MKDIKRVFNVIHNLKPITNKFATFPQDEHAEDYVHIYFKDSRAVCVKFFLPKHLLHFETILKVSSKHLREPKIFI